jgi:hypothetical protein
MGDIPGLDLFKAKECVNQAWADIRRVRRWSFLSAETSIDIPNAVTAGTASVTQFSDQVVPDAAAKAVWDVLGMNIPLTARQFRVGSGPLYQITAYDDSGAGALTLERAYKEATDTVETYSIYRAYFTMPADFLSFTDVKDIQNGRSLITGLSREDLDDFKDPQRQSFGDANFIAARGVDSNGEPLFELWPHQLTAKSLVVRYERAGTDFASDSEALPAIIPESLLMERALCYAARWAMANQGRYPELKGTNWVNVSVGHEAAFSKQLWEVQVFDEEMFQINITQAPEYARHGGNSRWLQSHDDGRIHY